MIETRTDTHAIISRRPKGFKRFTSGPDPGRYVVQVNEDGLAPCVPRSRDAHKRLRGGDNMATKDKNAKKSMEKKPAQKTLKEKRQAKKAKK